MPKDKHPPYFPFYVDDFIADSAVDAMTNEELGIYTRLLCKAWKEDPVGTIPADDRILANWGKTTAAGWKRCRDGVLRAFVKSEDGLRYRQKRMQLEWQKILAHRESKSKAGSSGANKRWHSHDSANGSGIAEGMAKNGYSSSSSSSPSISGDGDDDGAKYFSSEDMAEIVRKRNRLARVVGNSWRKPENRALISKVAILWHSQALSDDDVEQVVESYDRNKNIGNRAGWMHKCFVNRCKKAGLNFEQLLKTTEVPPELDQAELEQEE